MITVCGWKRSWTPVGGGIGINQFQTAPRSVENRSRHCPRDAYPFRSKAAKSRLGTPTGVSNESENGYQNQQIFIPRTIMSPVGRSLSSMSSMSVVNSIVGVAVLTDDAVLGLTSASETERLR